MLPQDKRVPIRLILLILPILLLSPTLCIPVRTESVEEEQWSSFWLRQAQDQLRERLARTRDSITDGRRARNVVMFLGDGLSIATMTAARILKGQRSGGRGEEAQLAVERFPFAGLSKTYCLDEQTPDSACTATAYLGGVKTRSGTVGQSGGGEQVDSVLQWAQRGGKATGVVTTTRLTDASPAGAYAHVRRRGEELEIARQLVEEEPGRAMHVILGGGLGKFANERSDGKDLLAQWRQSHPNGCFSRSLAELRNCSNGTGDLLGLFSDNHMSYHLAASREQPRLSEMAAVAIERLEQKSREAANGGYFLFIEGGRIDHGHHETRAGYALDEMLELDAAVEAVAKMTDARDTLLVVTADHAHTLSMAGYARRGTPILGMDEQQRDVNGVPYSTLNYAIGKWQSLDKEGRRESPARTLSPTSYTPSYIHGRKGVHSGEDVAVFAMGPQAHLFGGVMEQNLLPHLMGYAACLGSGITICNHDQDTVADTDADGVGDQLRVT
ncbi:alkaline phosphatase, tissue-nonspecific isozyme [Drosophila elegans]|uniref:alkaline phosphatase, tissue-nonspecific isozyme n=1 Tax=Drosophila elegans TaxID=30023 RepID=UPI0007E751D9|nr:alkaline phosphatase, tissue-nonspecific isozyme [Drosophila elegans]